ncbi:ATP-dependent DNA helicase RecG [Mesonia sp. K7]|uniref:ATP-dependent DNA helicase RecG n=1 Tax=Mesonia sp. K7 TaxID=2218606 RepID=UPI000DA92190|nr:ATP-dependent DNA helicase RecG [Mesonia sp. K7]PZD79443.1 ATP-dependent DNA helicase RecG [Mesonia sp. K7]
MNTTSLQTPIEYLKGVGSNRGEVLRKELNIHTYQDLLYHFPHRYIDKTQYYKINQIQPNSSDIQIIGKITHLKTVGESRGKRLVADFVDDTGKIELVWFRGQKYFRESLKINVPYVIFGKANWYGQNISIAHPDMELLTLHEKSLKVAMQPIYPSTEMLSKKGITNKVMVNMMSQLFVEQKIAVAETLPNYILEHYKLISKNEALFQIHFPQSANKLALAEFRLKFEELFYIQLQLLLKNQIRKQKIKGYVFENVGDYTHKFYNEVLPFDLTNAQKKVLKEIRNDLGNGAQMNRLLQGDVGSGKTIVAFMTCLLALDNQMQTCIMAPTEILATQHYNSLYAFAEKLNLKIALLTGSTKTKERKEIHESLENGSLDILVGTHAVLEDKVQFKNLGLAIIDEQHRFGVAQRAKLWKKNAIPPHILVMTATPIPRTLAMSLYGDLDISVIDELPPGRKSVKTVHRRDGNRLKVFRFIKDEIKKGRQVYIVYPLIQESEKLDYKDLMDGYESIAREFPTPEYQISIVHGKMKAADKDYEMNRFVKGETQIMVATTVIEVGVNVPNASVMIIESAERFGLSQLHQLRGRVGRGAEQSYCILMTGYKLSEDSITRIQTMTSTSDGFEIAEVDLKLRGPGDLMGTQQSGILNLRIADILKDNQLLQAARAFAKNILSEDSKLELPKNQILKRNYILLTKDKKKWQYIS